MKQSIRRLVPGEVRCCSCLDRAFGVLIVVG